MKNKIKELLEDIVFAIGDYVEMYRQEASDLNKICTLILTFVAMMLLAINLWQNFQEHRIEEQSIEIAESIVAPSIESLKEFSEDEVVDCDIIDSSMKFFIYIKEILPIMIVLFASVVLGDITDCFKYPLMVLRDIAKDIMEYIEDEAYYCIPMMAFTIIDAIELYFLVA